MEFVAMESPLSQPTQLLKEKPDLQDVESGFLYSVRPTAPKERESYNLVNFGIESKIPMTGKMPKDKRQQHVPMP
jgi:hypothetical protein